MIPVDVIVPVNGGLQSARRCIESALAAPQVTPWELVVVDDASSEPELRRWLRELARSGRVTLLEQPIRMGFAAAVNRAHALHADRDCIVLHSDAEVANDWLDRLHTHAYSARDIGTVAPFASAGGVAGYPRPEVGNELPKGMSAGELDLMFRRANRGESVTVPVTCGPCVYIRRDCISAVGILDGGPQGSAYGVAQDFSLRASSAGFCHLLAVDVFIAHVGSAESGGEARALEARADEAIDRLYPQYSALRRELGRADPSRPFRRRVDLLRLAESPRHLVLFVSHGWGGGIRRYITDLATAIHDRCEVLLLEPAQGGDVKLSWLAAGEGFTLYFRLERDMAALADLLRGLGVARIHFHHVHGLPPAVLQLPAAVGVPYDCSLHDYHAICPQYHLVTEDGRYCGEPDAAGCTACLAKRPPQWNMGILAWRAAFDAFLRGAERVIAPSRDVAQRIARYFPALPVIVMPHPEAPLPTGMRIVRVVTLGTLSPEKGLHVVRACAEDARARALPLSFHVLGATTAPLPHWPELDLSVHGQYDERDLARLLAAETPDVIWLPAQVPETYAYTLTVALASGAPIVASAFGALPERLAGHPASTLLRWDASAAEWNEALLAAGGLAAPVRRTIPARLVAS